MLSKEEKQKVEPESRFNMLASENRLPRLGFRELREKGKMVHGTYLSLVYIPNSLTASRFGIVVSTKISKLATRRVEVKRKLRDGIRNLLPKFTKSYDILILTKRSILDKDAGILENDLKEVFAKAKLI